MEATEIHGLIKEHITSKEYQTYNSKKMLSKDESAEVFYSDVLSRVNLEFMGAFKNGNLEHKFFEGGQCVSNQKYSLSNLIVPDNTLSSITKLYTEKITKDEPVVGSDEAEKVENIIKKFDIERIADEQSVGGKLLLRFIKKETEDFSFNVIPLTNYIAIRDVADDSLYSSIIIFHITKLTKSKKPSEIKVEIHTIDRIEHRKIEVNEKSAKFIGLEDLTKYGYATTEDGLGYYTGVEEFNVIEVKNNKGISDYSDDLMRLNKELVVGNTINSNTFDKIMSPLLSIPESATEMDENGNLKINLQDRALVTSENEKVEQVSLESKIEQWQIHKENMMEQIYRATGTNKTAFGINVDGSAATSGESKRRALERMVTNASKRRSNIYKALEQILKLGLGKDIKLSGKDIISVSTTERLETSTKGYSSGIMSLESAVNYLEINNSNVEEEVKKIEESQDTLTKKITNLVALGNYQRNDNINKAVEDLSDNLTKEILVGIGK